MTVNQDAPLDRRTRLVIAGMALAAFMAVLNGTTVTAALEALGPSLGTTLAGTVWVTTVYLVAASASVPLVGWLTDRWGPARVLQLGLIGFVLGSLLCGFAWDLASMVVFRFLQGLAGGMLEPAAIALIGAVTPATRLGRVMGMASLVINVGPVAGPLLGGFLVAAGSWPWIFWVNVPLGAAVGIVAWRLLPRGGGAGAGAGIDVVGLLLLPPGFVLVLLGMNRWGAGAPAGLVLGLVAVGLVLLVAYVGHARRAPAPLLDIRLLRLPSFAAALGVMSTVGLIMYTQLSVLPMMAQRDLGLTAAWVGLPVAVLGVGLMISMTLAGHASDAIGPRVLVRTGAGVTAVVAVLIAVGHRSWPVLLVLALVLLLGLGFGAVASPTFASVYRVLPAASVAQGTAALFIVVQLFASAGVTVVGLLTTTTSAPGRSAYLLVGALAAVALLVARLLPGRGGADDDLASPPATRSTTQAPAAHRP